MPDIEKNLNRRDFTQRSAGTGAIKPALVSWLAGTIVVAGFLALLFLAVIATAPLSAAPPEEKAPLDCLSCHARALKSHDALGSGSAACRVCHDESTMGVLHLFDGTRFPLADSSQLCEQCHTERYQAWQKGTHGILSGKAELEFLGSRRVKCVACHNPHQPKIDLTKLVIPPVPTFSESGAPLDCLSCHARVLKGHDVLGEGSKACWACHYNREMGVWHLAAEGKQLALSDYPQLCAQCHQERYADWLNGTHGMPGWEVGMVEVHGVQRVGCISCHDPHQPQIAFSGITRPHPPAQPPPSQPSVLLLALFGISLVLIVAVGVAVVKKGEWP